MAASSSTAVNYLYDVFINHSGPDVKKTLASHLYRRLVSHGLRVFLDQPELHQGVCLTSQIEGAIKSASVHVAVFSHGYADSDWCLKELLLILESKKTIIPIFYDVKPSYLRWTGDKDLTTYAVALRTMAKKRTYDPQTQEYECRYDSNTIENWRNALSRVADISGFELEACNRDQGELVDQVVKWVLKKVKKTPLYVAKYPTGLDEKVKHFENEVLWQQQEQSGKPPVVGIVGLGGVGKTTLAKELFNRKSAQYSRSCFLCDVRENTSKDVFISLQSKLLKSLSGSNRSVDCIDVGVEMIKQHLSYFQALIILDDVDDVDQVEALLPDQTLIRSDSLILITSRNRDILTSSGVEDSSIYKLTGLDEQHSVELFCNYAFMKPYPLLQFESLVQKFLKACQGLPLSLKVFGALLCGKKNPSHWEDQLDKLRRILPTKIKERLQISFEALDVEEQEIFLDVACSFIGEKRDMAVRIWDGSHWKGFQNLEYRCLVEVDSWNVIHMHDHLRDLGRDIAKARGLVRETQNIDDLLQQPSPVITEVRGIRTVQTKRDDDEHANWRSEVSWHHGILQVPESEDGLLERILTRVDLRNLIWLRWYKFPYSSLTSWIPMKSLRVLEVRGKKLTSLWEGEWQAPLELRDLEIEGSLWNIPNSIGKLKYLERISLGPNYSELFLKCFERISLSRGNFNFMHDPPIEHEILGLPEEFCHLQSLKTLVLGGCRKLKSLPDSFGNLRNLEHIDLSRCNYLERLPKSFGTLTKLKYLDLLGCKNLTMSSETLGNISTLEYINLTGCVNIEVLPVQVTHQRSLTKLELSETYLKELPNAIVELSDLEVLIVGSPFLETLPPSLGDLSNLKTLELNDCDKLKCLPASVGLLTQLTDLTVDCCLISELPCLCKLSNLKTLCLRYCNELKWLPDSVGQLTQLTELRIEDCPISELPCLRKLSNLKTLSLSHCRELKWLPDSVGQLIQLTELRVEGCPIRELPSLRDLSNLKSLELRSLKCLPASLTELTVSVETLELSNCMELECLPASVWLLAKLTRLVVSGCPISELLSLGNLSNLKILELKCQKLKCLLAFGLSRLQELDIRECKELEELSGIETLVSLKRLWADRCVKLKRIQGLVRLTKLRELRVAGCSELEELAGIEYLSSLEQLDIQKCVKLKGITGLAQLTKLEWINVSECSELEDWQGVEHLRSLKGLQASKCVKLKSIKGLAQLTNLWRLNVSECSALEDLEGVEHCMSLNWLDASGCPKLQWAGGVVEQLHKLLKESLIL